jgi:hypothetical protein
MKSSEITLQVLFAVPLLATWACTGEIARAPAPGTTAAVLHQRDVRGDHVDRHASRDVRVPRESIVPDNQT